MYLLSCFQHNKNWLGTHFIRVICVLLNFKLHYTRCKLYIILLFYSLSTKLSLSYYVPVIDRWINTFFYKTGSPVSIIQTRQFISISKVYPPRLAYCLNDDFIAACARNHNTRTYSSILVFFTRVWLMETSVVASLSFSLFLPWLPNMH